MVPAIYPIQRKLRADLTFDLVFSTKWMAPYSNGHHCTCQPKPPQQPNRYKQKKHQAANQKLNDTRIAYGKLDQAEDNSPPKLHLIYSESQQMTRSG